MPASPEHQAECDCCVSAMQGAESQGDQNLGLKKLYSPGSGVKSSVSWYDARENRVWLPLAA